MEVLTPDFKGDRAAIETVIDARPDTFNHNIETVPRLYPAVRPQAKFRRSLEVLRYAKELNPDGLTKSGFMVGLGEVEEEIHATMHDLREHDVDILTIGQYLRPTENHLPMSRYYKPKEFADLKKLGFELGLQARRERAAGAQLLPRPRADLGRPPGTSSARASRELPCVELEKQSPPKVLLSRSGGCRG